MFHNYLSYVPFRLRHASNTVFIRRVNTRPRAASGSPPYSSFRLVRSIRSGRSVRQVTLLNLGADFSVPQPQWPALLNPGVFRRQIFRLFWQQEGEFFRIVCDV